MAKRKSKNNLDKNVEEIINRSMAIDTIFEVFKENKKVFKEKMSELAQREPALFYKKYVEPLQPKEIQFDGKDSKVVVGFKFTEVETVDKKEKSKSEDE